MHMHPPAGGDNAHLWEEWGQYNTSTQTKSLQSGLPKKLVAPIFSPANLNLQREQNGENIP